MRKLIHVKAKHIRAGKPGIFGECAIALAAKDAGFPFPRVYSDELTFDHKELIRYTTDLPRSARRFVKRFDKRKANCKPFRFFVDVDAEAVIL